MHIRPVIMLQVLYINRIMVSYDVSFTGRSRFYLNIFMQRIFFNLIIVHPALCCIIRASVENHRTHQQPFL